MISIHQWINEKQLRSKMILQVHDELVFDVHEEEVELLKKEVKHRMEKA
jgi:DNA polymerase-1